MTDEIIDWWNLRASDKQGGVHSSNLSNGDPLMCGESSFVESLNVDVGGNTVTGQVSAYLYEVFLTPGSSSIWLPRDPNDLKFAYSLHVLKGPFGLHSENPGSFSLYPNPSNNKITIEVDLLLSDGSKITIVDVMGRTVLEKNIYNVMEGQNKVEINIAHLRNGIYYCNLTTSSESTTVPFSKID